MVDDPLRKQSKTQFEDPYSTKNYYIIFFADPKVVLNPYVEKNWFTGGLVG